MALEFEITDEDGVAVQDISDVTSNKRYTPRLNAPWTASGRFPSHEVPIADFSGLRLKVRDDGDIVYNGLFWTIGDDGDEDTCYTEFTSISPVGAFFPRRPARDADGDFSKPSFLVDFATGPQIIEEILANSVTYEGDMGIASGTWATAGADLSGVPVDWPMTLADIYGLLVATGELDVVEVPSDTTDGVMVTLDGYNGDYGDDLSATVNFDWGTGDFNARAMRRTWSLENICNKLWYYLGPRVLTSADPAGDQHWKANVTGTHPDLPDPPQTDIDTLITASRAALGVFMDIRIFDGDAASSAAPLYLRRWQTEALLRAVPRQMLYVTPVRGTARSFHIGDLISLNAGAAMRGGFSGAVQRVYSYTVAEDDDGVVEIVDITTSADQEGF